MIALVFDIDDTLYDREQSFRRAYAKQFAHRFELDCGKLYQAFFIRGNEALEASLKKKISQEEMSIYRMQRAMADCGASITAEEALAFHSGYLREQNHITLDPGIKEVLDLCRENNIFMGILTNGNHAHQYRKYRTLDLPRWIPEEAFLASEDVGFNKPDPRAFRQAEAQMRLIPENTWYIGDSYSHDILGAHAVGWHSIWLDRPRHALDLSENLADVTVHTTSELRRFVLTLITDSKDITT